MSRLFKNTDFKSSVHARHRQALEELVYFNPCQSRVRSAIVDAVENFGSPEIVVRGEQLTLELRRLYEAQTVFAVEQGSGRPLGLVMLAWPKRDSCTILHVSIAPEFALGGVRAHEQLLLRFLREVRSRIRSIKGVKRMDLYYQFGRKRARRHVPELVGVGGR